MVTTSRLLHNLEFGPYKLDMPIASVSAGTVQEFTRLEYAAMRPTHGERIYKGETVQFLMRHWKTELGCLNGNVFKIGLTAEADDSAKLAADIRRYWADRLGMSRKVGRGLEVWDAPDGNIVLQTVGFEGTGFVSLYFTSDAIRDDKSSSLGADPKTQQPQATERTARQAALQFVIAFATAAVIAYLFSEIRDYQPTAAEQFTRILLYGSLTIWGACRAWANWTPRAVPHGRFTILLASVLLIFGLVLDSEMAGPLPHLPNPVGTATATPAQLTLDTVLVNWRGEYGSLVGRDESEIATKLGNATQRIRRSGFDGLAYGPNTATGNRRLLVVLGYTGSVLGVVVYPADGETLDISAALNRAGKFEVTTDRSDPLNPKLDALDTATGIKLQWNASSQPPKLEAVIIRSNSYR